MNQLINLVEIANRKDRWRFAGAMLEYHVERFARMS